VSASSVRVQNGAARALVHFNTVVSEEIRGLGSFPKETASIRHLKEGIMQGTYDLARKAQEVRTFDVNLNPVEADISYKCFDRECDIGRTKTVSENAVLNSDIPICINGHLIASADGYADGKLLFSSNEENFGEVILEREHEVEIAISMGGRGLKEGENAIVHFTIEDGESKSVVLPENNKVTLKEGLYDLDVFVYGNSNVVIPSSRKVECFEVSESGLFGFFGGTKEECVDIEIPAVNIDTALIGGGKTTTFILESELEESRGLIKVSELPRPTSLEQLQYNFEIFNSLGVDLTFG